MDRKPSLKCAKGQRLNRLFRVSHDNASNSRNSEELATFCRRFNYKSVMLMQMLAALYG